MESSAQRPHPPVAADDAAAAATAANPDAPAVSLQHRHVFGLKNTVKGTVHFTDEAHIVYPAGHNSIHYLMDQRVQARVFPGTEGSEGITCMAVSPSRKFLAVCEKFSDSNHSKAICSIFDINTGKRRRGTLSYGLCDAKEFVCCAFSADSKYLITQGGPPDWTLVLWSWDKARHLSATRVSNHTGSVIHECSFSPQDNALICVIGDGVFKFFRLQENQFRNIPNQLSKLREASNQNYVCHAWLNDDKLVVCSEAGDALLFDGNGEFKMTLLCSPGEMRSMLCVVASPKGFIAGGEGGAIRWFDRIDDKEYFRKTKEAKLDSGVSTGGPGIGAVTALAVSPSEETLAIATNHSQLLQLSLNPSDLLKPEDALGVENIVSSFHTGAILGLDVCVRKPLVVTCGSDKSVRIWNYIDKTQELCKFFGEEAYSVAFHPSGFHLIVGFSDKLRLMNLLMEDMRMYKEIPIKACRECRFSHGGQFFAAVNSNTIQVYKTYTCEVVCSLRGHQSKVRSVCWTADDSRLVSTGSDGSTFEFDIIKDGRRASDWPQKGTNFSCVIAYTDPATQTNTMYVVGSDKMLKEVQNSLLKHYVESNVIIGQLALASTARALFAGVAEPDIPGPVRCYAFPLDGDYAEYQAHSAPVSRLRITFDENYLFSAGEDGCLVIFDVMRKTPLKRDKDGGFAGFADEILVTKTFLDDKQTQIMELDRQVEELTNQIDLELRQRDSYHKEKMALTQEKFSEEIETERRKYEVLREEKSEVEMEFEKHYRMLEETHSKQTSDLEASFRSKMHVEMTRYEKLAKDKEREQAEWEASHSQMFQEHEGVIEGMKQEFEKQQQSNWNTRDRIVKEKEAALKAHHETLKQLEQDADREIEELKEMYEQMLAQEKDEKVRLRGQAGIHRKHHEDLQRRMQKKMDDVRKEEEKNRKADEKIAGLRKEKDSQEKEINERDKTIADKEQRICDLKKQNQELEKFKFVLHYKITELKAQIDPKNDDIASMRTQIQAMDAELDEYVRKNKQLALDISQLQMKQRALQEEIKSQKRRLGDDMALIKRFKLALTDCMDCINEPKALKDSVANLYRKYVQSMAKKMDLDTDQQKEYNRQREYLEKSVESLKSKLEKDSQAHRIDNMRRMQENVSLIREINDLQREINALKNERTAQELQSMNAGNKESFSAQSLQTRKEQEDEIALLTRRLQAMEASSPRAIGAASATTSAGAPGAHVVNNQPRADASAGPVADGGTPEEDEFADFGEDD